MAIENESLCKENFKTCSTLLTTKKSTQNLKKKNANTFLLKLFGCLLLYWNILAAPAADKAH